MIDKGINQQNFDVVKRLGLAMVAITTIGIILHLCLTYFVSRLTTSIVVDIRDDMFANIRGFRIMSMKR